MNIRNVNLLRDKIEDYSSLDNYLIKSRIKRGGGGICRKALVWIPVGNIPENSKSLCKLCLGQKNFSSLILKN